MKESTRKTQTAALDLSYRFNKLLIRNNITPDNATGDNSPWGSFSEYTRLNPYLRPYGEKRRNQEEPASMARSQRILEYRPHTEPHVQHHFQL